MTTKSRETTKLEATKSRLECNTKVTYVTKKKEMTERKNYI